MTHRYPGPRSFTGDDRHLFFGRDPEKQELFRLIVLNDLVVLFGESGTGKTSLLQAGVCPALEEQQYKPVFIRLNNTEEAPELQVCHQLKEGGFIPVDMPEDRTLWEYFSRFWYVDLGEVYIPVIVFDQFEELFTLYQPEQRAAFIEQFAAIANRRPPIGQLGEALAAPKTKFVFSLRSDFLYLLDELSADIPSILRCRFQLRLLDRERASDAVTMPAAMAGEYASPNFGYSTTALEGILEELSKVSEDASSVLSGGATSSRTPTILAPESREIAAFQLQLVCRQLEEKIIRKKQSAGFQVTPEFYGDTQGIRQIIEDFYHKVLEKIAPEAREAVEKLLARGLLRSRRRIMMEASAMRDEYGVSQASLELLHDERLLKREARKGELYYEISHDTLVKPILERFKKIEEAEHLAEAKAFSERLRVEAEEAREKEFAKQKMEEATEKILLINRQKRLARAVGVISFLTLMMFLGFGTWFINFWIDSVLHEYRMVEENFSNEQFAAAHSGYENLYNSSFKRWVLKTREMPLDTLGNDIQFFREKFEGIENLLKEGDSLFFSNPINCSPSLSLYRKAMDSIEVYRQNNYERIDGNGKLLYRIRPHRIVEREYLTQLRINNVRLTIIKNFIILQKDAESFSEAKVYGQVYRALKLMNKLLPQHEEDISILQNEIGLNVSPEQYINNMMKVNEYNFRVAIHGTTTYGESNFDAWRRNYLKTTKNKQ